MKKGVNNGHRENRKMLKIWQQSRHMEWLNISEKFYKKGESVLTFESYKKCIYYKKKMQQMADIPKGNINTKYSPKIMFDNIEFLS